MNLRTKATETAYLTFKKDPNFMQTEPSIQDFTYWRIINNNFPYDNVWKTHHMLVPKTKKTKWSDLSLEEISELATFIDYALPTMYDSIMYNLPHNQSVPEWFHIHLLKK